MNIIAEMQKNCKEKLLEQARAIRDRPPPAQTNKTAAAFAAAVVAFNSIERTRSNTHSICIPYSHRIVGGGQ